ncbi:MULTISPECIES: hypothetical protein [Paenibacillus]|uniref:DUF4025 domain-containing protein n=1 Tax=Paenibacillus radicis (ex Xue et al. 2023) TaxID=2972489 RepID=A0ABT1YN26_9BACL|nr:hypothetical protein [Paenibacillus radicis (ex Xue et al. 2023)]MCR8634577.1 hypothetical protein [Paenibacillus radicis (ex Xue et al. 2023)]
MPKEKINIETDGNPETVYEDTAAHERTGFMVEDTKQISYEDVNDDVVEIKY